MNISEVVDRPVEQNGLVASVGPELARPRAMFLLLLPAVCVCNQFSDSRHNPVEAESESIFGAGSASICLPSSCSDTCRNREQAWVDDLLHQWRVGYPPFRLGHVRLALAALDGCLSTGTSFDMGQDECERGIHLHVA